MIFRWLNNNMRCFEIADGCTAGFGWWMLNNNMRCFEMIFVDRATWGLPIVKQ